MSYLPSATRDTIHAMPGTKSEAPAWFAVQTRPRHEKKVSAELLEKGVTAFLPLVSITRQWSDRSRVVELPLFPQYVFVRIAQTLHTRVSVLRTNGVTNFVGTRGIGVPIPDDQMEHVQTVVTRRIPATRRIVPHVPRRATPLKVAAASMRLEHQPPIDDGGQTAITIGGSPPRTAISRRMSAPATSARFR